MSSGSSQQTAYRTQDVRGRSGSGITSAGVELDRGAEVLVVVSGDRRAAHGDGGSRFCLAALADAFELDGAGAFRDLRLGVVVDEDRGLDAGAGRRQLGGELAQVHLPLLDHGRTVARSR